jgi:hypothetical protein
MEGDFKNKYFLNLPLPLFALRARGPMGRRPKRGKQRGTLPKRGREKAEMAYSIAREAK